MNANPNPREFIGANNPPSAIELTKPVIEALGTFLKDYPVITNEIESREAKVVLDRTVIALQGVEKERDDKVRPLNEEVRTINAGYHKFHNTNKDKPGLWNTLVRELTIRLTKFAKDEEDRRQARLAAARKLLEETERRAREADAIAREAAESARQGVCEDFAASVQDADTAFSAYEKAGRQLQRAEKDTKVRIVGGAGNAISLREREILAVTDWKLAIEAIGFNDDPDEPFRLPKELADMLCKCARAYRNAFGELPAGITATYDRSL